jgi:hypothetical protein
MNGKRHQDHTDKTDRRQTNDGAYEKKDQINEVTDWDKPARPPKERQREKDGE